MEIRSSKNTIKDPVKLQQLSNIYINKQLHPKLEPREVSPSNIREIGPPLPCQVNSPVLEYSSPNRNISIPGRDGPINSIPEVKKPLKVLNKSMVLTFLLILVLMCGVAVIGTVIILFIPIPDAPELVLHSSFNMVNPSLIEHAFSTHIFNLDFITSVLRHMGSTVFCGEGSLRNLTQF